MKTRRNLPPIARRLRALLDRKNLSQADVAAMAGMSQASLSELLRGVRRDVMLSTVERIVEAAGGTMCELYETDA